MASVDDVASGYVNKDAKSQHREFISSVGRGM